MSMSLLADISANALDPGYAEAAERRAQSGPAPSGAVRFRPAGVALGLAGLLLATAAVQAHLGAPAAAVARNRLLGQVRAAAAQTQALGRELDILRARTAAQRSTDLAATTNGAALDAQVRRLERSVGEVAVSGPGLVVQLSDAAASADATTSSPQPNRVMDRDLQAVVNALWAAGAEAIAVNGQRLTAETAIRSAGAAILVDLTPVSSPYLVEAVGDPVGLETAFGASATAGLFRTYAQIYGLGFSYHRTGHLSLAAASALVLRYATPAREGAP